MYSRKTELRHIQPTDLYKLGQILDPNGSWKKLMQIIPRNELTVARDENEKSAIVSEYKYNNDDIRLVESESIRQMRLATEILFDEWGTSGRKRPTVGQLLDLLVKAELFRAADLVALSFLNESAPNRPSTGPAAKIDLSLPFNSELFCDVEDMLNNVSEPNTEALLDNANQSTCEENMDFYTKYGRNEKDLNSLIQPIPPPRTMKQSRQQQQQQNSHETITQEIPRLSQLLQSYEFLHSKNTTTNCTTSASTEPETEVTELSHHIPIIRTLEETQEMFPVISALNITNSITAENDDEGHVSNNLEPPISFSRTSCHTSESSNIDDNDEDFPEDFDDEDVSAPNRSLLEQRSSNNDSSLTNVTGTSGDNSFELSMNDGSFDTSNDNIPHLSVLLQ